MFDKENSMMLDECIDDKKFQKEFSQESSPNNHKKSHSQNPNNDSVESELRPRPFSDIRNMMHCSLKPEQGFSTARDDSLAAEIKQQKGRLNNRFIERIEQTNTKS